MPETHLSTLRSHCSAATDVQTRKNRVPGCYESDAYDGTWNEDRARWGVAEPVQESRRAHAPQRAEPCVGMGPSEVTGMHHVLVRLIWGVLLFVFVDLTPARAAPPDVETVSFESVNKPGWFVRHSFSLGVLSQFRNGPDASVLDRSALEKMDATFVIRRPGLSGI